MVRVGYSRNIQANLHQLPTRIGCVLVTYSVSEPKGHEAAPRIKLLHGQIHNDSNYDTALRPGVMKSSESCESKELLTTAGIPVRSRDGERFTVGLPGFLLVFETIYHPNGSGSLIGDI